MKKTYITTMPDHIGAFLKASECFAKLGINITRVSYNKAIDSHTLFIDAEGTEEELRQADTILTEIGYLQDLKNESSIVLLEFMLEDHPGSVTEVLRLIHEYRLNISYISSQEDGTPYQAFKMGLYIENAKDLKAFLADAERLCPVRVLDYNHSEKASWLSSHGRGLRPRDALKKDSRGLSRGAAGNPRVPRLLPGTLGNLPGCL